ncbi:MAG: BLUF domain-containing protein, partial [Bacteroidota bacterium]
LVQNAATSNLKTGVTGLLFFWKNHFLQYVEGENHHVRALIRRIEKDPRHEVKCLCIQPEMTTRKFKNWNMCLIEKDMTMELMLWNYLHSLSGITRHLNNEQRSNIWRMVDIITYNQLVMP